MEQCHVVLPTMSNLLVKVYILSLNSEDFQDDLKIRFNIGKKQKTGSSNNSTCQAKLY